MTNGFAEDDDAALDAVLGIGRGMLGGGLGCGVVFGGGTGFLCGSAFLGGSALVVGSAFAGGSDFRGPAVEVAVVLGLLGSGSSSSSSS